MSSSDKEISFNRDVPRFLNSKCLELPTAGKANGEFSLLFEEDALSKTQSGKPAIGAGQS